MFEARLQVAFRGMPWEHKVRANEYYVSTHDNRIISPQYWTDMVSPHSKLRMSIIIGKRSTEDKDDKCFLQRSIITTIREFDRALELIRQGEYKRDISMLRDWWTIAIHGWKEFPWMAETSMDASIHLVEINHHQWWHHPWMVGISFSLEKGGHSELLRG